MFEMTPFPSSLNQMIDAVEDQLADGPFTDDALEEPMDEMGKVVRALETYQKAGLDVDPELDQARQAFDHIDTCHLISPVADRDEEVAKAREILTNLSVALNRAEVQEALSAAQREREVESARRIRDTLDDIESEQEN